MTDQKKPATILATAGVGRDAAFGAVAPPIGLSTTFRWDHHRAKPTYDYARRSTPNRDELTQCLAELEGAAGGVVTASGMAALDLCLNLVNPGDLVLAPHDCYGGTHRLLTHKARRGLFKVLFADLSDPDACATAFAQRPKLAYLETPSNPLMRITDLAACAALARKAGCLTVADNTFLSPLLQSPLALGCDLVVHSTTKFIAGHSDVTGGVVLAAEQSRAEELAWWANCTGVTGPAFDSWLTLRGVRTLGVRLRQQEQNAAAIAEALAGDARVAKVHYPGLSGHPQHQLAAQQQRGFGAMLSAELGEGVSLETFLESLTLPVLAESLGGFETLVCVPDTMTHAGMEEEARREAGITSGLLRFSVGLEDCADLLSDIRQALDRAMCAR